MHPDGKVVKVFGMSRGFALVMDQKAGSMAELDVALYERTLILIEQDHRDFETPMPPNARYVGAFYSEHLGAGFMVFALLEEPRRTGAPRVASGRE